MSFLLGGIKSGGQQFDRRHASRNSIILMLAVIALVIPSMVSSSIGPSSNMRVEFLSLGIAVIMISLYVAGLIYGFKYSGSPFAAVSHLVSVEGKKLRLEAPHKKEKQHTAWTGKEALIMLAIATLSVAYLSELLASVVEPVTLSLGISEFFLGVILIPIIGNVAEHLVAVIGVVITAKFAQDGESNWLEGAELLAVYLILSLSFFLLPIKEKCL